MSKTAKIKSDLDDVSAMVEVFQILKDVAANHFYNTAKRKEGFAMFAECFTDFFRMVNLSNAKSPLVHAQSERIGIMAITSEGGFMAEMTAKVLKLTMAEADKHRNPHFIIIGQKGVDKIKTMTDGEFEPITGVEEKGLYKSTLEIKKHIIEQVEKGKLGKVYAVYPRAMSINFIKPVLIKLLPSEELVTRQLEIKDAIEKVIVESDLDEIMHDLADIWLTCRIYEMLEDCVIAGFAAQSQQLEASLERLKKEKKGLIVGFRKSKKGDIDKSLREVFTAKSMTSGGRR